VYTDILVCRQNKLRATLVAGATCVSVERHISPVRSHFRDQSLAWHQPKATRTSSFKVTHTHTTDRLGSFKVTHASTRQLPSSASSAQPAFLWRDTHRPSARTRHMSARTHATTPVKRKLGATCVSVDRHVSTHTRED
jgi:hypothetical protein